MNSCLKYFFVVFNLLFLIGGLLFVAFSLWLKFAPLIRDVMVILQNEPVVMYTIMGLGAFMTLVGLCGTCGTIYKKKWLLGVFIALVVFFLAIEIFVVVYGVINKDAVSEHFDDVWTNLNNATKFQVQRDLKCCGYKNASEWGDRKPMSCYRFLFMMMYESTCYDVILEWLVTNVLVVGGGAGVVLLVEIIQIILASLLIRSLGLKNRVENEDKARTKPSVTSHVNEAYERHPTPIDLESIDGNFKNNDREI